MWHINLFWGNHTVSDILSALVLLCNTCSVTLLVLCNSRLFHVSPTMSGHLVYYELLLLSQVGLRVWGRNQMIRRCGYKLISGEGFLIAWEGLDRLLPAVRVCTIIEDESLCLLCTVPLWSSSWIFESLSMHCLLCGYLEELTYTWCSLTSF